MKIVFSDEELAIVEEFFKRKRFANESSIEYIDRQWELSLRRGLRIDEHSVVWFDCRNDGGSYGWPLERIMTEATEYSKEKALVMRNAINYVVSRAAIGAPNGFIVV